MVDKKEEEKKKLRDKDIAREKEVSHLNSQYSP